MLMRKKNIIEIILLVVMFGGTGYKLTYAQKKVVGYYPSWYKSIYLPTQIDYKNLTHIIHCFVLPGKDGSLIIPSGIPDSQLVAYAHAAGIKVLISIGGGDSTATANFVSITSDSSIRSLFVNNLISFVQKNHYDGVDLDWEFPSNNNEKNYFAALVKEIKINGSSINPSFLLTVAVGTNNYFGKYMDYENITQYVDWFNMMGYNFHGSWSPHTGHNAPLFTNPNDPDNTGSDNDGVNYIIVSRNVPKSKVMLGVPFYGLEFNASGLFTTWTDTVRAQIFNKDIIPKLADTSWNYDWDSISDVPFMTDAANTKFVTFDDTVSIRLKCNYVKENDLAGIMIWALGYDYYNGESSLLSTIGLSLGLTTGVDIAGENIIPSSFKLYDNYPNPFNPSTSIRFVLPHSAKVKLIISDVLGREVRVLCDGIMNSGLHETTLDASNLSSGVYFYTLITQNFIQSKKMILLK